jgi:hypothetical protein
MRVSRPFVLAALALTVAACGTTPASGPGAGGGNSGNPPASGAVTVTEADNGRTVTIARGKVLVVKLGSQGMLSWDRPRLTGPMPGALRELSASGGYPSHAPVVARFLAVRPGTATLSSVTDARCLHVAPKCAFPQRGWHVTVIVHG